jgi:RNA recognition motif-containing protein
MKRIYVGNLPFSATEDEVRELFGQHGTVNSVNLISDRETGRPRGFGFVEMEEDGADSAISALDGTMMGGRSLKVNEARPRESRPRGGGGGGFGGGGNW